MGEHEGDKDFGQQKPSPDRSKPAPVPGRHKKDDPKKDGK